MFDVKSAQTIWDKYTSGMQFNNSINLFDTVEVNENFYIDKQWEGVTSNGLPTPSFNFIKRIVSFLVASIASDNIKSNCSPLMLTGTMSKATLEDVCKIINCELARTYEHCKAVSLFRQLARNTAVDGDGCLYAYFDESKETGQETKGAITLELIENTRVLFGNPNERRVQRQPYIMLSQRMLLDDAKEYAKEHDGDPDSVKTDSDDVGNYHDGLTDDKVTVVTTFWKDRKTKTVHAVVSCQDQILRKEWDTGQTLYPIVWWNWDYVQNSYHGQAAITGLIPNQIFVNKMYAMSMLSLMTTAYPKVIYDKTRVSHWDSGVGKAIGINGGDVNSVARILDPAAISTQVDRFINAAIELTKDCLGSTSASLGEIRNPRNASAIMLQDRASKVPLELHKQDYHQCVEDLNYILLDIMAAHYGIRYAEIKDTELPEPVVRMVAESYAENMRQQGLLNASAPQARTETAVLFDFELLRKIPMLIQVDIGESSYWSEISTMATLDNLLTRGKIEFLDYLERIPDNALPKKQELIEKVREAMDKAQQAGNAGLSGEPGLSGNGLTPMGGRSIGGSPTGGAALPVPPAGKAGRPPVGIPPAGSMPASPIAPGKAAPPIRR